MTTQVSINRQHHERHPISFKFIVKNFAYNSRKFSFGSVTNDAAATTEEKNQNRLKKCVNIV